MATRRNAIGTLAAAFLLAAAAPAPVPPGAPPHPVVQHASNADIVDQFMMLAFDADPGSGTPARAGLARWTEGMRLFVSGDSGTQRNVAGSAAAISHLVGLPIDLVSGGQPNGFLSVSPNPVEVFRGPLHQILLLAMDGDPAAADAFVNAVVGTQACWVLPVWADRGRSVIKAAIIGIDARQGHPGIEHCIVEKLAAAMGLLGADGYLRRSVFNPQERTVRLSFEDQLTLRLLYSPALAPGLDRETTAARAHDIVAQLRAAAPRPAPRPKRVPHAAP